MPADLLGRIVAADAALGGFAPADYGLESRERLNEAISRAWQRARAFWGAFVAATEDLPSSTSGVTETREQWVLPLLRTMGYQPEFRAAAEDVGGRRYAISHRDGVVPLHIVSSRQDLDRPPRESESGRRLSPHALVQEFLNRSEGQLYGLVSNGHLVRLLRDNQSLTRLSYLEFDLRAMMEGAVYADFVLLWLCLHRTRLPQAETEASTCWLERWRSQAESQGTRAMGALRSRVEQAVRALGTGFLAHPKNEALRARLRAGELTVDGFYAQLLRLLYRFLFVFVVEERDLLLPPEATAEARRRYTDFYSLARLRDLAARHLADQRHDDLWQALRLVFAVLGGRREGLDLKPVGGGLFDEESCPDLGGALLPNAALAEAVVALSTVQVDRRWRRVNYRDMDVEELGGVYESLLERQPSVVVEAANPRFELVGSGTRKQTGSYYTPSSLVHELIKSALDPVIAHRLAGKRTPEEREAALLRITVGDAAVGSGHFLIAAARRLADELAHVRSGGREPSPQETRRALRDVIRHCLYGVDVNPLAVDLCRLTLWLESHEPGKPLTFLDHRIKLGNSLIGATPELVAKGIPDGAFAPVTGDDKGVASETKKRNKQEREGQMSFASDPLAWPALRDELGLEALEIAELPEDGLVRVAEQRTRYKAYRRERVEPARLPLDLWTAAFFWPLVAGGSPAPTTADVREASSEGIAPLSLEQWREMDRLRTQSRFFHWPLEFPEVFAEGGFDCVLGNPPWERIKLQEQEFFAERDPEIAMASNKAARQRLVDTLTQRDPALARVFAGRSARQKARASSSAKAGDFPSQARAMSISTRFLPSMTAISSVVEDGRASWCHSGSPLMTRPGGCSTKLPVPATS